MSVTAPVAAALAAKYPHLAAQAAKAVALDPTEQVRWVAGKMTALERFRKYRMPTGQVVVLDGAVDLDLLPTKAAVEVAPVKAAVEAPADADATPVPSAGETTTTEKPVSSETTTHQGGRHRK